MSRNSRLGRRLLDSWTWRQRRGQRAWGAAAEGQEENPTRLIVGTGRRHIKCLQSLRGPAD